MKTFIVIKLKENLYDSRFYQAQLSDWRQLNPNLSHYGPLQRLSTLLFAAVAMSLTTSFCQITIGLIDTTWALAVCFSFAGVTLLLVIFSLIMSRKSLMLWFNAIEDELKQKSQQGAVSTSLTARSSHSPNEKPLKSLRHIPDQESQQ